VTLYETIWCGVWTSTHFNLAIRMLLSKPRVYTQFKSSVKRERDKDLQLNKTAVED